VGAKRLLTAAAIAILVAGSLAARAAGSQSGHWAQASLFHQMDANKNGTVSKIEFLRFMSRKFNGLDTNRNGRLERKELLPLVRGGAMRY
jgi:Ca2+-binding EF-hand superfamily protein